MSDYNQSKRTGMLKSGYMFNTVGEVAKLWNVRPGVFCFHNRFDIPGHLDKICIVLSEAADTDWSNVRKYGTNQNSSGWNEVLQVEETHKIQSESKCHLEEELAHPLERYVFWKEEYNRTRFVIFYGVFKIDVEKTREKITQGCYTCVYRRVSEIGECVQEL